MSEALDPFALDYQPGKLVFGRDCVADLAAELDSRNLDRALVVCGETVGSTPAVMDPVTDGLGDRLVGVFDRTKPEKYLATAVEGAELAAREDAAVLVAVGGGSSLDTAKVMSALAAHDGTPREAAEASIEQGYVPVPDDGDPLPLVVVPTTMAGADLSVVAGVTMTLDPGSAPDEEFPGSGVADRRLMPEALCYDPALFETTPRSVLTASAMNGFDKGVEALYTRNHTPVTDATAMRGLRLFSQGAATLADDDLDDDLLSRAVAGLVLVQYGVSDPDGYRLSIIHAFGHGFTDATDAHQGTVHGIVAPHVLAYVFDRVDGRRDLLAEALGVDDSAHGSEATAQAVVDAVAGVRDDLGLPTRLRELDGLQKDDLPDIAGLIMDDGLMGTVPEGLDPTREDVEAVLREAW